MQGLVRPTSEMTPASISLLSALIAGISPFNGTWVMELGKGTMPADEAIRLDHGTFTRGDPADIAVPADGKVHSLGADEYTDAAAVTVLSPLRVHESDRLNGRNVYDVRYQVSPDRRKLVREITDLSKPVQKPISTKISYRRIGIPVPGSHALSGRWRATGVVTSREHLTEHIAITGNSYSIVGPGGYGYKAVIGGAAVPVKGDALSARTAISMPNDHTIVEEMSLKGKATVVKTMTLLRDQRTIRVTGKRVNDGTKFEWLMYKQ